jgi:RNA polymerase sigma factor for flagellar operon FliA
MATQAMVPGRQIKREARQSGKTGLRRRIERTRLSSHSARSRVAHVASPAGPLPDRDQLVVKLLPLVKKVAYRMRAHLPAHVEMDDLVGTGLLGLLDAVRRFDAAKHVQIETYARHRIRGAIIDGLRNLDTASRDMRKKNNKAQQIYHALSVKLGRPVADDELATAMGVSLQKWYEIVEQLQPTGIEWLRPMEPEEAGLPDLENLAGTGRPDPFELCARNEQSELLNRALLCLSERDRQVIALYYQDELTMREIGDRMGVDESRISQVHSAALARLRNRVKALLRPCPQVPKPELLPAYGVTGLASAPRGGHVGQPIIQTGQAAQRSNGFHSISSSEADQRIVRGGSGTYHYLRGSCLPCAGDS